MSGTVVGIEAGSGGIDVVGAGDDVVDGPPVDVVVGGRVVVDAVVTATVPTGAGFGATPFGEHATKTTRQKTPRDVLTPEA